jgi:hypothetical protein
MTTEPLCGDALCPCRDGLACHYRDAADGTAAIPPVEQPEVDPEAEPSDLVRAEHFGI